MLEVVEAGKQTAGPHELGQGPALMNPTLFEDDDLIGVFDGGQPMGNHDHRAVFAQRVERILDP